MAVLQGPGCTGKHNDCPSGRGRRKHITLHAPTGGRARKVVAALLDAAVFVHLYVYMYTQYSDSVNFQVMTITQRDQH